MWRFSRFVWRVFMLDVTHIYLDVEKERCGVTDSDIFIHFYFKMIFSILQVPRDRRRFLTASVRHLSSMIYCKKWHCLETVKYNGCTRERPQYSRDLFRAQTLANWLYCNVVCHVFGNRQRKIWRCKHSLYNVRKLHFQANLCEVFAENKQQHYCGDLVLGW